MTVQAHPPTELMRLDAREPLAGARERSVTAGWVAFLVAVMCHASLFGGLSLWGLMRPRIGDEVLGPQSVEVTIASDDGVVDKSSGTAAPSPPPGVASPAPTPPVPPAEAAEPPALPSPQPAVTAALEATPPDPKPPVQKPVEAKPDNPGEGLALDELLKIETPPAPKPQKAQKPQKAERRVADAKPPQLTPPPTPVPSLTASINEGIAKASDFTKPVKKKSGPLDVFALAVREALEKSKFAPSISGVKTSGVVTFTISQTGRIEALLVSQPSASAVLDRLATNVVRGANFPVPPPGTSFADRTFDFHYD